MKKTVIILLVVALVAISTLFWFLNSYSTVQSVDWVHVGIIFAVLAFGLIMAFRRMTSVKRGEPIEDERSKGVLKSTAAISFYISLYLWVFLIYIKDRVSLDCEEIMGTGVLGMAIVFILTWIILHFKGNVNE